MGRKGLDDKDILNAAVKLIAEQGIDAFSIRGLSRELNVKSASMYNHFSSLDELMEELAREVVGRMNSCLYSAIEGLERKDAVVALFNAYRDYVHSYPELYQLVIRLPQSSSQEVSKIAEQITGPVVRVLEGYKLSAEQVVHCQRYLRSLLHGFSALEHKGYLSHWTPPADVSYSFIASAAADYLCDLEKSGGLGVE